MAKLAVLLATLALILFLANASITTVTVDSEVDNPWRRSEGSCQEQIRRQNYLKHCQNYMEERCSGGSCVNRLRTSTKYLDSCCEQLRQLDRQCRCPGLKQAVMQQFQGGQTGKQEMFQMAERIMSECDMEPRRCDMPFTNEENPWRRRGEGSCQQQIKKQNYLRHCQQYMEEESGYRGRYENHPSKHLDSCCEELEKLDTQCRCPGLMQAMQQQMPEGQQEMFQMAQKIMSKCDMEPRRCEPRSWF